MRISWRSSPLGATIAGQPRLIASMPICESVRNDGLPLEPRSRPGKSHRILFIRLRAKLLAGEPGLISAEDSRVLERIENNWRARQGRVTSFHFVWTTRVTMSKEFLREHRGENGRTEFQDERYETPRHQLWVDGNDKMRTEGMKFNPNRPLSTNQTIVSEGPRETRIIRGKTEKQLTTFPNPNEIALGQVFKGTERESWRRTRGESSGAGTLSLVSCVERPHARHMARRSDQRNH